MKVTIETIPYSLQRYPTVGDWQFDGTDLTIRVSQMSDPRFEWLVARHELDEAMLCILHGVTEKEVDDYDNSHPDAGGDCFSDCQDSPYFTEHNTALAAEYQFSIALGVDWKKYTAEIEGL